MTSAAAVVTASDPAAQRFERIYAACHLTVLNTLRRGLANAWQAVVGGFDESVGGVSPEELAQETWLRLWRKWPDLLATARDDRMLIAYALTTARHVLIDHQRTRQMRRRVGECALTTDGWESVRDQLADLTRDGQPEARTLAAETLCEAVTALRSLPQTPQSRDQLDTFLVAMATGATLEATAARLGVSIGVVKMREMRLRQALRAMRATTDAGEPTGTPT